MDELHQHGLAGFLLLPLPAPYSLHGSIAELEGLVSVRRSLCHDGYSSINQPLDRENIALHCAALSLIATTLFPDFAVLVFRNRHQSAISRVRLVSKSPRR